MGRIWVESFMIKTKKGQEYRGFRRRLNGFSGERDRRIKIHCDRRYKKEMIAFANCEGGKLYIGVQDDGTVIGLDNPDETALLHL